MYKESVTNVNFNLLALDCFIGDELLQIYVLVMLSYCLSLTSDLEKRIVSIE